MKAIILAAGRGSRMGHLTTNQPKCLTPINGIPLIEQQLASIRNAGLDDIVLVTGYKADKLALYANRNIHNKNWAKTNMVSSLLCARKLIQEHDCVICYSDIFFEPSAIKSLIGSNAEIAITYDPHWYELWSKRFKDPLDDAETFRIDYKNYLLEIGNKAKTIEEIEGQYMGILKISPMFWSHLDNLDVSDFSNLSMTELLSHFISKDIKIKAIPYKGIWGECDSQTDWNFYNSIEFNSKI